MTLARYRNWILIVAAVLLTAIAAFFLHARWLGRRLSHDVPYELAKTIQQSTQGFTHSESRGGHTLYTLHASKAVQFKRDGHAELHDVSITLFNAQGAPANRIYGHSFDWDPVKGIARALGEVQIDFQGDASPTPKAGNDGVEEGESKNTVHVKTAGLVFNKQTGLASTTERIEFRLSAAAGSAVGASFNSQTGVMILDSQVAFSSSIGGSPLSVRARHAQFDRESRLLYLLQDESDFADSHCSSAQATVAFRADGSAYQVEAEGNVVLTGSDGQRIDTRKAQVDLGPKSAPERVKADGGLLYVSSTATRQLHGSASSGTMLLGPQLTLRHAQLRDAVSLVDVETYPPANDPKAGQRKANLPESRSRQVQATQMDVDFASGPDRSPQAEHIQAAGGARLNVHTIYHNTPPQDTTVRGDQLLADLTGGESLTSVRGTGHTSLVDVDPNGIKQSSTGDTLLLTFASGGEFAPRQKKRAKQGQGKSQVPVPDAVASLQSAVQQGHVTITQELARNEHGDKGRAPAAPSVTTAYADRADYEAVSQTLQLSGSPRVSNASGEVAAASIELEHTTGNATAVGGVKATYRQSSAQPSVAFAGAGPVHVVADHAHLEHATDVTTFYGKAGAPARLWRGSDSVEAPVLELSQTQATLSAHAAGGEPSAVTAIFVSEPGTAQALPTAHSTARAQTTTASAVRLRSRTLFYADSGHKATFAGGVIAQTATGTLRANSMDIFFAATGAAQPAAKAPAQQSSSVERIVARGGVELLQPGRKGAGEELVYTAADSRFVLTGTSSRPPQMNDQVRGTVTGTSLIFNDRDDSVIVDGGTSRTMTQTRVAR